MALTRSASGPGGLSINTSGANSLFGSNTSQAPSTGGMFGSTAKPATGGLFGGSTATTSAPAAGGLFGNTGGLFGSSTTTTSAAPASGGLFGGTTATSQPAQTGGLFGGSTAGQTQQSGSLFGAPAATSQPQQTGGLFGPTPSQNQSTSTGSLFGGINNQNKPASSLFGQPQQNQQQPQNSSGFGSTLTGGLTLGQNNSNAPSQPGVKINLDNLRSTTRFNDLHEDLQKGIEELDKGIQHAQSQSHDINAILPSHDDQLSLIPDSVEFASRKVLGVESALESDAESLDYVRRLIERDLHNATHAFRAIDVLMLPQQYQHPPRHFQGFNSSSNAAGAESQDLVSFFSQTADEMTTQLETYQKRIGDIESHLRSVEAATIQQAQMLGNGNGGDDREDEMREVALVLREFESGILSVAGKVGATREGLQKLQLGGFEELGMERGGRTNSNGKRSGIY